MIKKKIWYNFDCKKEHANKTLEMYGWYLFGIIPLYIVEYRTI